MPAALAQVLCAALEAAASAHFIDSPRTKSSCQRAAVLNILYISPGAYLIVIAQILRTHRKPK